MRTPRRFAHLVIRPGFTLCLYAPAACRAEAQLIRPVGIPDSRCYDIIGRVSEKSKGPREAFSLERASGGLLEASLRQIWADREASRGLARPSRGIRRAKNSREDLTCVGSPYAWVLRLWVPSNLALDISASG
ncbi:hypothetical protein C8Q78DRAFT_1026244 [Trametes maxima]|nr:hypothetical protein C8Q78DRAFT_1026244 [Trametes maxima]